VKKATPKNEQYGGYGYGRGGRGGGYGGRGGRGGKSLCVTLSFSPELEVLTLRSILIWQRQLEE
jgi:hypothetical protein